MSLNGYLSAISSFNGLVFVVFYDNMTDYILGFIIKLKHK